MVFLPKGAEADDLVSGPTRTPATTRPLALKNTDMKLLAASVNYLIKFDIERHSPSSQRGFLPGRNFLDNITVLDTAARR
eukprot:4392197-Pyramimonas_sp.AAC.1